MSTLTPERRDALLREVGDRTRRMETRITKFLEEQGFDTGTKKPVFDIGREELHIPSAHCSVRDMLQAIPHEWPKDRGILVLHEGEFVMVIYLEDDDV